MTRKTVTIRMRDDAPERTFHLHEDKAARFAASIIAQGGTATIGPLQIEPDLAAMLARAGVNPTSIR